jgi:hypothetical protein
MILLLRRTLKQKMKQKILPAYASHKENSHKTDQDFNGMLFFLFCIPSILNILM